VKQPKHALIRTDSADRVTTRRADAVKRIVAGRESSNRFEAAEAEALRRADETFGRTRAIRKAD
jgi:hypothetical protein